jgi:hypothetical protein
MEHDQGDYQQKNTLAVFVLMVFLFFNMQFKRRAVQKQKQGHC